MYWSKLQWFELKLEKQKYIYKVSKLIKILNHFKYKTPNNLINIDLQYLFRYKIKMSITKKTTTYYSPNFESLFHIQAQKPAEIMDK